MAWVTGNLGDPTIGKNEGTPMIKLVYQEGNKSIMEVRGIRGMRLPQEGKIDNNT